MFGKRGQWDTGIVRPAHDAARLGRRQIVADARLRYCVQQLGMRASKWRPDFFLCTAKSPPQRWKVPACLRKPSLTRCRLPRWFLKAFRITPIQRKQQLMMMSASLIGRLRSSALRPSTNSSVDVTHGLARATRGSLLATYGWSSRAPTPLLRARIVGCSIEFQNANAALGPEPRGAQPPRGADV